MAISTFKKLNEAFNTLHSNIFTKEEISLTKKEKATTLNKNRLQEKIMTGNYNSWFEMEQEGLCCEGWEWVQVKQILGGVVFMSVSRRGEKRGRGWRNRGRRKEEDWVRGGALLRSFNMLGNWQVAVLLASK